jgi:hypothetical protein
MSRSCELGDRAALCRPRVSLRGWPACRNEFSSGHWPASGVVGHNCGCHVDGSLDLPRDRLRVVSCWRGGVVPQTAGRRAVGVLFRTVG